VFSLEAVTVVQLFAWIVPGVVIVYLRSRFLVGRLDAELSIRGALGIALVYAAVLFPLVGDPSKWSGARYYAVVLIVPAVVGVTLGVSAQFEPIRRLSRLIGLKLIHDIPSAWDYVFSRREPRWVLVTLKDGTIYRGCYVARSFASSDPSERDLYLEELCSFDEKSMKWTSLPDRSILVCKDSISTIELVKNGEP
jgi:hypothetical protein